MYTLHWLSLFFFTDTATTEIYTLSLHDALPISADPGPATGAPARAPRARRRLAGGAGLPPVRAARADRKSTRLNSSHVENSYAVFCLKKKNRELHRVPLTRGKGRRVRGDPDTSC